jgi:hypothetical protein
MFRRTNPQTSIFESQFLMPPEKAARMAKSWAEPFRTRVLGLIDEEMFRDDFAAANGRPNASIRLLVGLHLLKEWNDLTDEQVLDQLEYNLQWHYALGVETTAAHLCQKTLHNFRVRLCKSERAQEMLAGLTRKLAQQDGLRLGHQRLDSTHFTSNIASLTRLGLFVETVTVFLKALRDEQPAALAALPAGYTQRYLEREGYFSDAKREQVPRRLAVVAQDLWTMVRRFAEEPVICKMPAYLTLHRLFTEQCEVVDGAATATAVSAAAATATAASAVTAASAAAPTATADSAAAPIATADSASAPTATADSASAPIATADSASALTDVAEDVAEAPAESSQQTRLRDPKSIRGDSLQSPHDPDATYGHKGKGYEAQISETCDPENPYQVITGAAVTAANASDQHAVIPMLDQLEQNGMRPNTMSADTAYGSGANIVACAARGVDLQAPVQNPGAAPKVDPFATPVEQASKAEPAGGAPSDNGDEASTAADATTQPLGDFTCDTTFSQILSCPAGHSPTSQHLANDLLIATFAAVCCQGCLLAAICPTRLLSNGDRQLRRAPATLATARRQVEQQERSFKERYRIRSGIESTNRELKHRHGLAKVRGRGRPKVEVLAFLKMLSLNVKRAVHYHVSRLLAQPAPAPEACSA